MSDKVFLLMFGHPNVKKFDKSLHFIYNNVTYLNET